MTQASPSNSALKSRRGLASRRAKVSARALFWIWRSWLGCNEKNAVSIAEKKAERKISATISVAEIENSMCRGEGRIAEFFLAMLRKNAVVSQMSQALVALTGHVGREFDNLEPVFFQGLENIHQRLEGDGFDDVGINAQIIGFEDVLVSL